MYNSKETLFSIISRELNISVKQVVATVELLEGGATMPFISRYRKEATGGLDEVAVGNIKDRHEQLVELESRKEFIIKTIDEQGSLADELKNKIISCFIPPQLEDIYLPFKPKRRTRATIAREKGLEPLAAMLMRQDGSDPMRLATKFLNKSVENEEDALAGASDIIAEWVSENERARSIVRRAFATEAEINSKLVKGKEEQGIKFSDYFEFSGLLRRTPSHRILALFRGEAEGVLRVSISPDDSVVVEKLKSNFIKGNSPAKSYVEGAVADSYKRLIKPSIENETRADAKERADIEAIKVFAENLRQLLLAAPLGQKRVMGIDPGFRTGCKVVCLDAQGDLLHNETIYPHPPQNETSKSMAKISQLVEAYKIEAIAVGDGTAGRETEQFLKKIHFTRDVQIFIVSEDGASIYSASAVAREEFPQYDVTVRGSVSIARRLLDPLAELVKIDPKSIGVGQYQHDVDQNKLKNTLDSVVESCVNRVGVNLNTASKHLLTYVSGLSSSIASNIVSYRTDNGEFLSRAELMKVARLGAKAYEQCAGFLRIPGAYNPLDNSAVHPESYHIVEKMAKDMKVDVQNIIQDENVRKQIKIERYVTEKIGIPTLSDIMEELAKPGRDPRSQIKIFEFAEGVHTMDDLKIGMELPGIVTNITNFGAFVDIGIKQDGLVHISHMADRYVANPADVVKLHEHVRVKVLDVDTARGRINLSMKLQ